MVCLLELKVKASLAALARKDHGVAFDSGES